MSPWNRLSLGLVVGAAACTVPAERTHVESPVLTISEASLEFGTVAWRSSAERTLLVGNAGGSPLGIADIAIGDHTRTFSVAYDACSIECPDAEAKGVDADTGGPADTGPSGTDTGPSGTDTGAGPCAGPAGTRFVLDPGCQIPVTVTYTPAENGEAYDAVVVRTIGPEPTGGEAPYHADPLHAWGITWLHGATDHAQGRVEVHPRSWDFGFPYPGTPVTPAAIEIANIGDGPLTLADVSLSATADPAFSSTPLSDVVLEPAESVVVDVDYTPTSLTEAYGLLAIQSSDLSFPTVDVTLSGNLSTAPNVAPTVSIVSPAVGTLYDPVAPLDLHLEIADPDQPVSALACEVESVVLRSSAPAPCTPTDDTGQVDVALPGSFFGVGADTLRVTVTDVRGAIGVATVPVRIASPPPADDTDGDGFGVSEGDCDDADGASYPEATEIYDGGDNDCDGTVDEGTEASDDDGDGQTELDGDCDDTDADSYTGAPERGDALDNDCDGVVDEGTALYDDDGDGFAEVNDDCDDDDSGISPGAVEVCNGLDDDCDGLRDDADGCVSVDTDPVIIGDVIEMERTSLLAGQTGWMAVRVFDADGEVPTVSWSTDGGGTFADPTALTTDYTAPPVPDLGRRDTIYAVVLDPDGHQAWAFAKVDVYTTFLDPLAPWVADEDTSTCAHTDPTASIGAWALGLALLLWRRRLPA
jgi:hypothetical protein